ncbi:hypothetical protein ACWGOQ_0006640 [Aquimarina sp. M1]
MKNKSVKHLLLVSLFCWSINFAQQNENPDVDRGVSYGLELGANESISIPLHRVNIEGVSIPITLSYNSKGMLVSDVPSNVGYGWKLNFGGEVQKTVNHIPDESPNGWFFHDRYDELVPNLYPSHIGKVLYESIDATPDIFSVRINNGFNLEYLYNRTLVNGYQEPFILNQSNSNINISTNFEKLKQVGFGQYEQGGYTSTDDFDISINDNKGINYLFRKGIKRRSAWDLERKRATYIDSFGIQNYYIHRIETDFNTDFINYEYLETPLNKYVLHGKATRVQTNEDPRTYPTTNDPIVTSRYESQISVQDVSGKDIKKIITPYETIEFSFLEKYYNNSFHDIIQSPIQGINLNEYMYQKINLIDEIKIFDHRGNYISGYKFNYTEQTQDQNLYEGQLKIKSILKYAKNHKNFEVYRKFDYYYNPTGIVNAVSMAQDVFGYPNEATNNSEINITPIYINPAIAEKLPNENRMIKGMLKTITTPSGGKKEYTYQENSYNTMYYGGLIIKEISTYDKTGDLLGVTDFVYEEPIGFGLPVYDETPIASGEIPNDTYKEGYYEHNLQMNPWQTYFTKRDPAMDEQNYPYLTAYTVSNIPYGLKSNTSLAEDYILNFQLQNLDQLEKGMFYSKITTRRKNVLNNQYEKGSMIRYYKPSLEFSNIGKRLQKTEYLDKDNNKKKEVTYEYETILTDQISLFQFDNFHYVDIDDDAVFRYNLEEAPVYKIESVLRNTEIKEYFNNNSISTNKTSIAYLNENNSNNQPVDYGKIKALTHYFNGEVKNKVEYKYLSEYPNISVDKQFLVVRKNPKIETNDWLYNNYSWILRSSTNMEYLLDGKPYRIGKVLNNQQTDLPYSEQNFISSSYDIDGNLISLAQDFVEFLYDDNGKLLSKKNSRSGLQQIYQRGEEYNGLYIDAILNTNLVFEGESTNFFVKKSFENPSETNVVYFDDAFSGDYVFDGTNISLGDFDANYKVSYWTYIDDKWSFNSYVHPGGNILITKPQEALYIDEIRVQPVNSSIQTLTLKPLIGQTSNLNNRYDGERIEYDIFGRATFLLDKDRNVLIENRNNLAKVNTTN